MEPYGWTPGSVGRRWTSPPAQHTGPKHPLRAATFRRVRSIWIGLAAGDDSVYVVGRSGTAALAGNLHIRLGAGDDRLELDGLRVSGRTRIRAGSGNDVVEVVDAALHGLVAGGGRGDNHISVRRSRLAGHTRVVTGSGRDRIELLDNLLAQRPAVRSGRGRDRMIVARSRFGPKPGVGTNGGRTGPLKLADSAWRRLSARHAWLADFLRS